jgi:DNA-binding NarL/FixJ family response regulator
MKTMSPLPTRILLADPQALVRQGVRRLLEEAGHTVVAEAADGLEAAHYARDLQPEVALLDLHMPKASGVEAAREILRTTRASVIVVTTMNDDPCLLEALQLGVRGCVLTSDGADELLRAIDQVREGALYLSPAVSRVLATAYRAGRARPADVLTPRERHTLQLIAEGRKTREIAEMLCISTKTVEAHRARIMTKLDIDHVAGLVRYALRHGVAVW